MNTLEKLKSLAKDRIVILDGAMGTMVQRHSPSEADYRGARFANHARDLKGNNDLLVLTRPEVIRAIHARTSTRAPTSSRPTRSTRTRSSRPTTGSRASSTRST